MATDEITAKLNAASLASSIDASAKPAGQLTRLHIGAKTDLGRRRENNEDKFEFYVPSTPGALAAKGSLLAVSDGMGGHAAGQIASELGLKTLVTNYYSDNIPDAKGTLRVAMANANEVVHGAAGISGRSGMGATLCAAVLRGDELIVGNIGDSRLYLLQDGNFRQVTEDHSWVAEQVKAGVLNPEEAELSPFRNVITRSLGTQPDVEPDITELRVSAGDVLLLCTDGLCGVVPDAEIRNVLASSGPSESCEKLVELALDAGGPDNVTVLVARVLGIEPIKEPSEG